MSQPKVVIAMSGGVDSSVAAALLKQQGYEVIGVMLRLWSEAGAADHNRCCTPDSMALARRVAAQLEIPFYAIDAQARFREQVVGYFLEAYAAGITPNPCLECNRQVRWGFLLAQADLVGAEYLATGHYARTRSPSGQPLELLRGIDAEKDQSYVLHVLTQAQLARTLFPLGEYTKPQVRALARQFDLPVAERSESQDLCFLGSGDYRAFLLRHRPAVAVPGPIVTRQGKVLGEHQGLAFYTIGQRKGIRIAAASPLYVIDKDAARNALVVGGGEELGGSELFAGQVNWISGQPLSNPARLQVQIRYRARQVWGQVAPLAGQRVHIQFEEPLRDITPGQAAVFYEGERCLGGGRIEPIQGETDDRC